MITILVICRICVFCCQQCPSLVMVGIKSIRVRKFGLILVQTIDVHKQDRSLGKEFSIHPLVWRPKKVSKSTQTVGFKIQRPEADTYLLRVHVGTPVVLLVSTASPP